MEYYSPELLLKNTNILNNTIYQSYITKIKETNIKLTFSPLYALVRLFLPPELREDEEYAVPLVNNM